MTYSDKQERPAKKLGRMDAVGSDDVEIADKVVYESVHSTTFRSRSGIQSTQSRFKLIRFNDGRRGQAGKPVGDVDAMTDITDIPSDADNQLLFKNYVEYEWARFI